MEAVDWEMHDRAANLVDWRLASQVGARLTGGGPQLTDVQRARLSEDFGELVPVAEGIVSEFTALAPRVLARRAQGGSVRRKGLGLQVGLLMGYVSRKVLGQYDLFLSPDDEGLLYFVGPNVAAVERRLRFKPRDV